MHAARLFAVVRGVGGPLAQPRGAPSFPARAAALACPAAHPAHLPAPDTTGAALRPQRPNADKGAAPGFREHAGWWGVWWGVERPVRRQLVGCRHRVRRGRLCSFQTHEAAVARTVQGGGRRGVLPESAPPGLPCLARERASPPLPHSKGLRRGAARRGRRARALRQGRRPHAPQIRGGRGLGLSTGADGGAQGLASPFVPF